MDKSNDEEAVYDPLLGWHRIGDIPTKALLTYMHNAIENGHTVWVKFTCQNCQARQTSDDHNTFHVNGYTCEECGKVSYPKVYGTMMVNKRLTPERKIFKN